MNAIDQAMAAAKAAAEAAQAAAPQNTAVATAPATSMAMTAPVAKGPALTMETVMTGQLVVDAWLKPKDTGLFVGENKEVVQKIVATIDMTDGRGFIVKKGIKAGNPAQYWYTTDGVTCVQGGSWEAAVAKAKGIDSKAYEYRCVDLPFEAIEPVMGRDIKTGVEKELYPAGTKLGYTTSTTNWKNWEGFFQDVAKAELMNEVVVLNLGCEERTNKAGNNWGVVTFELVDALSAIGGE